MTLPSIKHWTYSILFYAELNLFLMYLGGHNHEKKKKKEKRKKKGKEKTHKQVLYATENTNIV